MECERSRELGADSAPGSPESKPIFSPLGQRKQVAHDCRCFSVGWPRRGHARGRPRLRRSAKSFNRTWRASTPPMSRRCSLSRPRVPPPRFQTNPLFPARTQTVHGNGATPHPQRTCNRRRSVCCRRLEHVGDPEHMEYSCGDFQLAHGGLGTILDRESPTAGLDRGSRQSRHEHGHDFGRAPCGTRDHEPERDPVDRAASSSR